MSLTAPATHEHRRESQGSFCNSPASTSTTFKLPLLSLVSMVSTTFISLSTAAAVASLVDAHGYVSLPKATYANTYTKTGYSALLTESVNPAFRGKKWDASPDINAKTFTECFRSSGFSSLRELLDPVAPGCGNSRIDVPPVNVSSLSSFQFQNDEEGMGFIRSHHGPCELWIDETRMFHGDDCSAQFAAYPAVIPVDYSACAAGHKCTLTFYWLALHEPNWQAYKQCVPILRGSIASPKLRTI